MARRKKKDNRLFVVLLTAMLVILLILILVVYLRFIDRTAQKILDETDTTLEVTNYTLDKSGLYILNVKSDLDSYLKNKKAESVTYKINGENFRFEVSYTEEDGKRIYEIDKIIDDLHSVKAKMNLKDIEKIKFRTGNTNNATLIQFVTEYDTQYFVITEDAYYFLGSDIEEISYIDGHFYYMSYNSNYKSLREVSKCTKEVEDDIYEFNKKDYYYKYGKINFLDDYYQKLASKTYTVGEYCESLEK